MIENLEEFKNYQYDPQYNQLDDVENQWRPTKSFRQLYRESNLYAINGNLKGNIGR